MRPAIKRNAMSKYIDADRLKAELEKRLKNTCDYMNGAGMNYKGPKYYKAQGKESAYDAILNLLDFLQQESAPSKEEVADRIADWISRNPDFFFNADPKDVINELKKLI